MYRERDAPGRALRLCHRKRCRVLPICSCSAQVLVYTRHRAPVGSVHCSFLLVSSKRLWGTSRAASEREALFYQKSLPLQLMAWHGNQRHCSPINYATSVGWYNCSWGKSRQSFSIIITSPLASRSNIILILTCLLE